MTKPANNPWKVPQPAPPATPRAPRAARYFALWVAVTATLVVLTRTQPPVSLIETTGGSAASVSCTNTATHDTAALLAAINTDALEYAPCISDDQLELFFTRIANNESAIYRSTRRDRSSAWEAPRRISAITGFAEAPTIAPGGRALYYHVRRNGRFVIERVMRKLRFLQNLARQASDLRIGRCFIERLDWPQRKGAHGDDQRAADRERGAKTFR